MPSDKSRKVTLSFEIDEKLYDDLCLLYGTGFYGLSLEETARLLLGMAVLAEFRDHAAIMVRQIAAQSKNIPSPLVPGQNCSPSGMYDAFHATRPPGRQQ